MAYYQQNSSNLGHLGPNFNDTPTTEKSAHSQNLTKIWTNHTHFPCGI